MASKKRVQNTCAACDHKWYPRGKKYLSAQCPKCKKGKVSTVGIGSVVAVVLIGVACFMIFFR
jgi:Zn finger protein HypA/HybF involved in hydrogenase expression